MSELSVSLVSSLLEASWFISSAFSALHFMWLPSSQGKDTATCADWLPLGGPHASSQVRESKGSACFKSLPLIPSTPVGVRGSANTAAGSLSCSGGGRGLLRDMGRRRRRVGVCPDPCPCGCSQWWAGPSSFFTSQLSYHLPGDSIPDHTSWNNDHPLPTPSHSFAVVNWTVSSKSMCWSSNTLYLRMWPYLETRSLKRLS